MHSWAYKAAAGALALGMLAAGCGGKRTPDASSPQGEAACEAADGRITIATGNSGGVYYVVGGGLAKLISDNTRLKATAAETGASVQNVQQLVAGDYDVAFSLADTAADAVAGKGAFEGKPQDVQALARLYSNYTQVLVRADSGIDSIADMRGKRISTGSPKSGTEVIANRLLTAAGLNPETDVQAQRLDLAKTADGMKDGSLDGLVWSGGLPTAQITDITTSLGDDVRFLDVTPQLDALRGVNEVYDRGVIPAATYGQPADVPTVVVPNLLLVRSDFPRGDACAVTKLLFERKGDLEAVHPAARGIARDTADETGPVPLHPGSRDALGG
ncbi:TAXI family TRAP transporter solute-binding subunit [Saccharothrix syringae]|uniref:TAXI family TRAP transporter solute-binding subunit n=1 Tax=Saccharothrix syringae TaxID=103733 RepID=A0A5Q0HDP4_SACSY|nr:TAXI family TRAP transporter solute-binding subunit [Saccharothrix syringae]QFZ23752.1 TAXI family TRAP transporter solute-binding subunit [Saccharothrix syringae]